MGIALELARIKTAKSNLKTAINAKGGTLGVETLDGYAAAVDALPSGGVPAGDIRVRFIDYDGTILQEDFINSGDGVVPPIDPLHIGLTFQGWNYASSAFSNITSNLDVGAMYITDDGRTRMKIRLTTISGLVVPVYLSKSDTSTLTINWGDTTSSTATNNDIFTITHTYTAIGDYTIEMWISSGTGTYGLGAGTSSYTVIGGAVQNYRSTLLCINIGSGVTSITTYAFYACYALTSITIPNGVMSIEADAFFACYSLTSVTIPSSVTSIGASAFYNCLALASITIPNGITSIEASTFYCCYSLASITIPNGVTSIGASAFYYCFVLTSITIPDGVTSIGISAFNNCLALASITIPSSVTSIGASAFFDCYPLTSITIPNGVTSIGVSAFGNCLALTSIIIPSSVTSIGDSAFGSCYSLASITIPSSVTSIGVSAFSNCFGVKYYNFESTIAPTVTTTTFTGILSSTKIYVPDASVNEYKTALVWKTTYANYIYPVSTME